jgi:hypothetical protein
MNLRVAKQLLNSIKEIVLLTCIVPSFGPSQHTCFLQVGERAERSMRKSRKSMGKRRRRNRRRRRRRRIHGQQHIK